MATFQGDSTDDEIGVNFHLAERLSINKGDHVTSGSRATSKKDQKQFCNQRKKKLYRDDQSSSSSSTDIKSDPSTSLLTSGYALHKKRQNGDKNIEQLANSKRTCLSDRFVESPERKDPKAKPNNLDVNFLSRISKLPPQPLNLSKRSIFPTETYEDLMFNYSDEDDSDFAPWRRRVKHGKDGEVSRTGKRQGGSSGQQDDQASARQGVDSASEDDSRMVRQNGALKGGRQTPDPASYRKVFGRKVKTVIESDDTDDDWQASYRGRRFVYSSSDTEDSGPSNPLNKKPSDTPLIKAGNLAYSPGDSFISNHDHIYHKPDAPFLETYAVEGPSFHVQASEPTTSAYKGRIPMNLPYESSINLPYEMHRTQPQNFLERPFKNREPDAVEERSLPMSSGVPHSRSIPSHQYQDPTKSSKGRFGANSREPPLVSRMFRDAVRCPVPVRPPLAPYEDYSQTAAHSSQGGVVHPSNGDASSFVTRGATNPKMTRHRRTRSSKSAKGRAGSSKGKSNLASRYPDLFDAEDSSEVEFFTANSYSDTESNAETFSGLRRANALSSHVQEVNVDSINVGSSEDEISVVFTSVPLPGRTEQRRGPRTLGRRYNRGSRHITQDVISISPDPVEQVRQMEEDEEFARNLQAQFDAETDPPYTPHIRQPPISPRPLRPISSSDEDSVYLENYQTPDRRLFTMLDPWNFIPAVVARRGSFRSRRQDSRRLYSGEDWHVRRILQTTNPLASLLLNTDDTYEAFLGLADLNGDVTRGLQKAEINRLPTRKYTIPNGTSTGAQLPHKRAELNKECQVCLSDYVSGDVLRILPCFHEFHTPCIDPWLKINPTCPVCRVVVNLE